MACTTCNQPTPCNCCPPPYTPNPTGCLTLINTNCITYSGNTIDCTGISTGQTLNQVIEELAEAVCDLSGEVIGFENFQCSDLESCSINNLGDVVITTPISGDLLIYNGTDWVNEELNICAKLDDCSIDALGDVVVTTPASGEILVFNGSDWVNVPSPSTAFECSDLNGCALIELGDVSDLAEVSGNILIYNGADWVGVQLTATNGLTQSPAGTFKLGGNLIENTTITGATFNLDLGTSGSKIGTFTSRSNTLDFSSNILSLNTTTAGTQTKGFLFKNAKTNISIGTDVFDDFDTYDSVTRIGDNITLAGVTNIGTFIGTNIITNTALANAIGGDISLTNAFGFYMGVNLTVNGGSPFGAGGTMFGSDMVYTTGGTGNQSAYLFGSNITLTHSAFINQGNLVFNPTSVSIVSSSTGAGLDDKIRVDNAGKVYTTFNSTGYYFFTNTANTGGWDNNDEMVIMNSKGVRLPVDDSAGGAETKEGMIRYNPDAGGPGVPGIQWYDGASWNTL